MTRGEHVQVIWTLDDWAQAVLELPVSGPCPERTLLVPNMRVAHALRCALIERERPDALIGTRCVTPLHLALEILGAPPPNDRDLGPLLALDAFRNVQLERFKADDLLSLPGWGEAFARTLGELEGALLEPDALCAHADPQVCDVGRIFGRVRARGDFRSAARLLTAATLQLASEPRRGTTLAVVTGFESLAEARLLGALPDLHWGIWGVRTQHAWQLARLDRLFGPALAGAARAARLQPTAATALGRLQASLFTAAPETGPADESLRIAIYAGVHEEVEAAVSWVVEQLVERGLRAQEIALLSPSAEPYAALLRARLSALPWPSKLEHEHSQAKVPLCESSDGARLLCVVRALRAGLGRDWLAALLPLVAHDADDVRLWGLSRAWELLNELDAVGGEPAALGPGCAWPQAFRRGVARLSAADPQDVGAPGRARIAAALTALLPAIDALCALLQRVIADDPLSALWPALDAFLATHLHLSRGALVRAQLAAALQLIAADPALEPRGGEALDLLEQCLRSARVPDGRFGMPQLYLGTLEGARGLAFRAVRVLGLVEGALPSAVREDAVLPDRLRESLSDALLTSAERAQRQLAAFDGAVRAARAELALSAPRVSAEGSVRQPAAVLLDVVQTLRAPQVTDSLSELLEQLAHDGRARERSSRERLAVSASARLGRIARGDRALAESDNPALSMTRLRALSDRSQPGVQDGLLPPGLLSAQLAGLTPERPISATRLKTLLQCPHQYLLERVLGFEPATVAQSAHALDARTHGSWLHEIAERFWREHGPRLGAREGDLAAHRAALRALAHERFELLRAGYPFAGDDAARAACAEICDQLDKLIERDWETDEERSFVDVERSFGFDAPCALDSEAGPLYVRGKIDKLDRDRSRLLVRDIKTSKGKPRRGDEAPEVDTDLQLALYGRVARVMARKWKTPARVHVAYLYLKRGAPERAWKGSDFARLEEATDAWLATAVDVLRQAAFARSARDEDCEYCAYKVLCAPELQQRSAVLQDARVPQRLAVLKLGSDA